MPAISSRAREGVDKCIETFRGPKGRHSTVTMTHLRCFRPFIPPSHGLTAVATNCQPFGLKSETQHRRKWSAVTSLLPTVIIV